MKSGLDVPVSLRFWCSGISDWPGLARQSWPAVRSNGRRPPWYEGQLRCRGLGERYSLDRL